MASPADFAQASRLRNVTSIRTSGDHGYLVGPEVLWAWFLHTNVMARALGLWPYKDVFHSTPTSETREVEALLSALSAGPVGVGDRIGEADIDADPAHVPGRRRAGPARRAGRRDRPSRVRRAGVDGRADRRRPRTRSTPPAVGATLFVGNVGFDKQPHGTRVALAELGADRPDTDQVVMLGLADGARWSTRTGRWRTTVDARAGRVGLPRARAGAPG